MEKQNEARVHMPVGMINVPTQEVARKTPGRRLRTVVADDSGAFLEVVCALLDLDGEIDIVARVRDGVAAVEATAKLRPDLVLMDIDMPALDGLNAAMIITSRLPATRIILMSAEESPGIRADAEACGAESFIHKPRFREEFRKALEAIETSFDSPKHDIT